MPGEWDERLNSF
jgi:hypothetical protein